MKPSAKRSRSRREKPSQDRRSAASASAGPAPRAADSPVKSEEQFGRLVSMGPAVIYSCGPAPEFPTTFISDNVQAQLGYGPEEFYQDAQFWTKRIHPDDRDGVLRDLSKTQGGETASYEYRFRHSEGHYLWLEDQVIPMRDERGRVCGIVGSWFNISTRKRADAVQAGRNRVLRMLATGGDLKEVLNQLVATIEEQAPGMLGSILLFDAEGNCLRHGAAPNLPAEYCRAVDGVRIGPNAGSCGTAAFRLERVIVTDVEQDPLWEDYRAIALQHGLRACWSHPIRSSTGKLLGTFAMYYHKVRGPTGAELDVIEQAANLAGIAIEQKQAEQALKESEERLRQMQKMEAVGRVAGGVAHDFNNILTAIIGYGELLMRHLEPDAPTRAYAEEVCKAAERAASITRQLLAFSHKQVLTPRVLDLNTLIAGMRDMLRSMVGERIDLRFKLHPDLGLVQADASQIEQIILNLTANARDAMPDGGALTVETDNRSGERPMPGSGISDTARPWVCLTVTDTGCGMDPDTQRHIFEPFYTTKPRGKGTGLGLATVYAIVRQSGGFITIKSEPGRGSAFGVFLPRVEKTEIAPEEPDRVPGPVGGSETVLLVEDERPVRSILARALRDAGYGVIEARDGVEAIRLFRRSPQVIDVVVTDLVMARMGGWELVQEISQSSPAIGVIFMSGHVDDHAVRQVVARSGSRFLQKPFRAEVLVSKVRETLDAARGRKAAGA